MVEYLSRLEMGWENSVSRSISAASVMAAGSVMNDPSSGTNASTTKYMAMPRCTGSKAASARTSAPDSSRMGRVAAITMIANTNSGSVKLRESR